jgi:hypothetical protein
LQISSFLQHQVCHSVLVCLPKLTPGHFRNMRSHRIEHIHRVCGKNPRRREVSRIAKYSGNHTVCSQSHVGIEHLQDWLFPNNLKISERRRISSREHGTAKKHRLFDLLVQKTLGRMCCYGFGRVNLQPKNRRESPKKKRRHPLAGTLSVCLCLVGSYAACCSDWPMQELRN